MKVVNKSRSIVDSRVETRVETRINPLKAMQVVDFPDIEGKQRSQSRGKKAQQRCKEMKRPTSAGKFDQPEAAVPIQEPSSEFVRNSLDPRAQRVRKRAFGPSERAIKLLYIEVESPKQSDMPNKRWILASACLWLCGVTSGMTATGNAHFSVRAWTTDDGLPQSSVIAMTRTRDGYLWLGTLNGLVRFDGIRFTTFDQNNTPGLNGGGIVHLFEDSRDGLWIISEDGAVAMVKDGRVVSETTVSRSSEHGPTGACEDSTGAVWLFTASGQLMRYPEGGGNGAKVGSNYFNNCRAIMAERTGLVRVGTANGLFTMDPAACQKVADPPKQRIDSVTNVDFLLASQHDGFWCLADGKIQKWLSNRVDRGWPYPWKQQITSACEDRDGNLIVGTYGDGVYWFDADGKYTRISRYGRIDTRIHSLSGG